MSDKGPHEKLLAIQAKLKAPKGQFNKFGGYSYRSCEDILEAVKPLLAEEGLTLTLRDEVVEVGGWHYVKATAAIRVLMGDAIEVTAYAREAETKKGMDASQITGTASSYARKYALNGLFLIDDTKDDDTRPTTDAKPDNGAKALREACEAWAAYNAVDVAVAQGHAKQFPEFAQGKYGQIASVMMAEINQAQA